MPKSRLSAVLSLLFVFVSGALAGALVYRAYVVTRPSAAPRVQPRDPADWLKHRITVMHDRLKLDDGQTAQLTELLNKSFEEMRQVNAKRRAENEESQNQMVQKIDSLLRPDQKVLYQQFREELQRDRERRQKQNGQMGPGGGPGGPPPPPPTR